MRKRMFMRRLEISLYAEIDTDGNSPATYFVEGYRHPSSLFPEGIKYYKDDDDPVKAVVKCASMMASKDDFQEGVKYEGEETNA